MPNHRRYYEILNLQEGCNLGELETARLCRLLEVAKTLKPEDWPAGKNPAAITAIMQAYTQIKTSLTDLAATAVEAERPVKPEPLDPTTAIDVVRSQLDTIFASHGYDPADRGMAASAVTQLMRDNPQFIKTITPRVLSWLHGAGALAETQELLGVIVEAHQHAKSGPTLQAFVREITAPNLVINDPHMLVALAAIPGAVKPEMVQYILNCEKHDWTQRDIGRMEETARLVESIYRQNPELIYGSARAVLLHFDYHGGNQAVQSLLDTMIEKLSDPRWPNVKLQGITLDGYSQRANKLINPDAPELSPSDTIKVMDTRIRDKIAPHVPRIWIYDTLPDGPHPR